MIDSERGFYNPALRQLRLVRFDSLVTTSSDYLRRKCDLLILANGADDDQLNVGGASGAADHIKGSFSNRIEVQVPVASSCHYHDSRNPVLAVIGMKQVGIRAVRQVFIAKNDLECSKSQSPLRQGLQA